MNTPLVAAASLVMMVGFAHSYLGERYILIRLFRRADLPVLFGSDVFTRHTLRMAWHLTTVAWWGLAAILVLSAGVGRHPLPLSTVGAAIAGTSGASAIVALVGSRGRHLSWVAFLTIGLLSWFGTH